MKSLLERQVVFNLFLQLLAPFSKNRAFNGFTYVFTTCIAKLNLLLNKPSVAKDVTTLAETWLELMPPDGNKYFKIVDTKDDTAYTEIHLHCPLRGSGNTEACYRLMNYDRKLMDKVGGQLIVLTSQSNSSKHYCELAIRKKGDNTSDLSPAHLRSHSN